MRKFSLLLSKELKELLTLQMIIPFVAIMLVFSLVGSVLKSELKKGSTKDQNLVIIDNDESTLTKSLIDNLKNAKFNIREINNSDENSILSIIKAEKIPAVFVFPQGFENKIKNSEIEKIPIYMQINNFSTTSNIKLQIVNNAFNILNQSISNNIIINKTGLTDPNIVKNPIQKSSHVIVAGKMANTEAEQIIGFVIEQTIFIPIILFMVIVLASQMIAVAIASEKENKTLETLLSTPIDRKIVVSAKMVAAGIVSLIMAAIYLIGMRNFMTGLSGNVSASSSGIGEIAEKLGLVFTTGNYLLLGLALFLGILTAIAMSIILGAFAEDAKSAQGVVAPLMILVMIPYFLTLMTDINSLEPIFKYLVYAIPFTHTFLAAPNILIGNYSFVVCGIIYQMIVFVLFVLIAAKIFSSDKIFTSKLNFGKKK